MTERTVPIHFPTDLIISVAKDLFAFHKELDWDTANKLWEGFDNKSKEYWGRLAVKWLTFGYEDD